MTEQLTLFLLGFGLAIGEILLGCGNPQSQITVSTCPPHIRFEANILTELSTTSVVRWKVHLKRTIRLLRSRNKTTAPSRLKLLFYNLLAHFFTIQLADFSRRRRPIKGSVERKLGWVTPKLVLTDGYGPQTVALDIILSFKLATILFLAFFPFPFRGGILRQMLKHSSICDWAVFIKSRIRAVFENRFFPRNIPSPKTFSFNHSSICDWLKQGIPVFIVS